MNRNKYFLTAGILLIVTSVLCLGIAIVDCVGLCKCFIGGFGDGVSGEDTLSIIINVFVFLITILFEVAECIMFFIFGRKLINYSKIINLNAVREIPSITTICYIFAILSIGYSLLTILSFGITLTAAILLSVGMRRKKPSTPHIEVYDKNNPDTQKDMIASQIKMLDDLHKSGALSDEDYKEFIKKVLGLNDDNASQSDDEIIINVDNNGPKGNE